MVHVTRQFTVRADQAAVVDYLKDFSHATEWDPGTVSCTRLDSGPVQVGSRWHNVSKLVVVKAELEYELVELRDNGVVFVGTNEGSRSVDTIDVLPAEGGVRVTYDANVTLKGKAKYAEPLLFLVFQKLARDTVRDLTRTLERLPRG